MILALLLSFVFLIMIIHSFIFVRNAILKISLIIGYFAAVFILWNPESTNQLARLFGIGRGVDLVLILLSVALLNGLIFYTQYIFSMRQNITKLTRYLAKRDAVTQFAENSK